MDEGSAKAATCYMHLVNFFDRTQYGQETSLWGTKLKQNGHSALVGGEPGKAQLLSYQDWPRFGQRMKEV